MYISDFFIFGKLTEWRCFVTYFAYFTALTCSSFGEAMGDFNEKIMLISHRKCRTALNFEVRTTLS